jgi:hypothetical protein
VAASAGGRAGKGRRRGAGNGRRAAVVAASGEMRWWRHPASCGGGGVRRDAMVAAAGEMRAALVEGALCGRLQDGSDRIPEYGSMKLICKSSCWTVQLLCINLKI